MFLILIVSSAWLRLEVALRAVAEVRLARFAHPISMSGTAFFEDGVE